MAQFTKLHQYLVAASDCIREQLAAADIGYMDLTINVKGRTESDLQIAYRVSANWDTHAEGGTLEAVLTECLRRKGWERRNAPLELPKPQNR